MPGCGNRAGWRGEDTVDHEVERRGGEFRPFGALPPTRELHSDALSWRSEKRAARRAMYSDAVLDFMS